MNNDLAFKISKVSQKDIPQMVAICAQNLVENNRDKFSNEEFSKRGFLIRKLAAADVEEMIEDQENFISLVLKNGDEVLGYVNGCDILKTEIEFQQKVFALPQLKNQRIFYHKQIAKKDGAKNVGKELLFAMFDEAKNKGYEQVVCKIVQKPFFNEISDSFHRKFGFEKFGYIKDSGVELAIYLKNL